MTHKSTIRAVQKMGENYDMPVCEWRDLIATENAASISSSLECTEMQLKKGYILVGDNIDKRVNPREMRIDQQVQSLHYFHSYAAKNRCESLHFDDSKPIGEILSLPMSTFLPTTDDCMAIRNNYIILTSRVIVEYLPSFSAFRQCVPQHIPHRYSDVMSEKSEMVSYN